GARRAGEAGVGGGCVWGVCAEGAATRSATVGPTTTSPLVADFVPSTSQWHASLNSPSISMIEIRIPLLLPAGLVTAGTSGWPIHPAGMSATMVGPPGWPDGSWMRYGPRARPPSRRSTGPVAVGEPDGIAVGEGCGVGLGRPPGSEPPGNRFQATTATTRTAAAAAPNLKSGFIGGLQRKGHPRR